MTNTIKLPQLAWHGSRELELPVPDSWQVEVCNMAGFDVPAMASEQIRAAIRKPLGSPPIRELAKGKKEVVIIFDDMTRVTRVAQIVPFVLEELAEAGIPDSKIRFISALGCHGAMNRLDFVRKLGEEVVSRFPVYNHNSFENGCTYVGTTSRGIRISANTEVMKCDFKIGIGSIVPHIMAGFGGGYKIILPGITSLETTEAFHRMGARIKQENPDKFVGLGVYEGNPLRQETEEAAEMVGLDIKVDCLFNMWAETTHVFAGNPRVAFAAGVEVAKKHYLSPRALEKDIVIANAFAKASEAAGAIVTVTPSVSRNGGDIVLICHIPEGSVVHYLMGTFGNMSGGPLSRKFRFPNHINRLIVFNEYPDPTFVAASENADAVILATRWDQVLELLEGDGRRKQGIQVAVYPGADIQYCDPTAGYGPLFSLT
jgi:nickel-dependent lactate racemase